VVDRLSDMIISGGEDVYPKEVENVLSASPQISVCAVVGIPDREWGEEVWAFAVPAEGMKLEERALHDFCRSRLAGYKIPRRIVACDALPKNYMDKIQKFILRKRAQQLKAEFTVYEAKAR